MKGLILSGGKGTRLRPITHTNAKQLIPIANKPILFYGIESLITAGITDIGIIVGGTQEEVQSTVGDGSRWQSLNPTAKISITYLHQEAPLGLAHAVKISRSFINNDTFIMYLGDNLVKEGLNELINLFQNTKPNALILLAHVPNPQQFGVAELVGDKVVRLCEKPTNPQSDLALVGVYMFDSTIFTAVDNIRPSGRNELEITDAIQYLINQGANIQSRIISGWWKDTGKLEDLLEANRLVLETLNPGNSGFLDSETKVEGRVVISPGAQIYNSTLRGPIIIGENTVIKNSYIGPFTSIYHDTIIENSEVEHSIILQQVKIVNIRRLADSLIGQNVEIIRETNKPVHVYQLMVGDSGRVIVP